MPKMWKLQTLAYPLAAALALTPLACTTEEEDDHSDEHGDHDDEHDHDHETEVISRVQLTFTPTAGGDPLVFAFSDPDGDGGVSGTADAITLAADTTYTLSIEFINDLEDPSEDITAEIAEEAEEHLILVAGDGISGPAGTGAMVLATHAYADVESDHGGNSVGDDLPVGLINEVSTTATGTSELRVMLRHLPDVNGEAQKSADIPMLFADGEALPGDVDVDVTFEFTVE